MRASVGRKSSYQWRSPPRTWRERLALQLPVHRPDLPNPTMAALVERFAEGDKAGVPAGRAAPTPPSANRAPASSKFLIAALAVIGLVPTAALFVVLWQDMMRPGIDRAMPVASIPTTASPTALAQPTPAPARLEVVLSSPEAILAQAGEEVDFSLAVDATGSMRVRSVIAVSAMPDGASFSEGRPYGATGWSFRPDEIGELRLRLPEGRAGASDLRFELLAADGAVLAESTTRLNVVAAAPAVAEAVGAVESNPFAPVADAEGVKFTGALPPRPDRKPARLAKRDSGVRVLPVKVVTIKPPAPPRPHDGACALGDAADVPAEWVEIASPVDMHTGPKQSSETVKVMAKGAKLRVAGRDNKWVQVTDPNTLASGWIYSRFLEPAEAPAQ
jgi:hypothetical protein